VQQLEIWMTPPRLPARGADEERTVEAKTIGGKKYQVVTFMGDNKAKVNGYINDQNLVEARRDLDRQCVPRHMRSRRSTPTTRPPRRQFPMHIVQKQAAIRIFDLNVSDVKANAAVNIQPAQGQAARRPQPQRGECGDVRKTRRRRLPHHRRLCRDRDRLQGSHPIIETGQERAARTRPSSRKRSG